MVEPKIIVFSSLFPSQARPAAGVFVRERMFSVADELPLLVISPVPWFPFQSIIRYWKPYFRPQPAYYEEQSGIKVYYPRFLSFPGLFKHFDGFFMALGSLLLIKEIKKKHGFNLIDSHFAYPDGYAATLLGKWFALPVTITLRGTEVPLSEYPYRKLRIIKALNNATKIFSVSNSLKNHAIDLGINKNKIEVIGNGININKFHPIEQRIAKEKLELPQSAKVIISVGGLVNRKGFHRVIELMPALIEEFPELLYLIVGGDSPEGGIGQKLKNQVQLLGLQKHVKFLGSLTSDELKFPLSAADLFVLATENEGWANVFLEAMACGLPVITTNVGGNQEVVVNDELGTIVPFGEPHALKLALTNGLKKKWKKEYILNYAKENTWETRVSILQKNFYKIVNLKGVFE